MNAWNLAIATLTGKPPIFIPETEPLPVPANYVQCPLCGEYWEREDFAVQNRRKGKIYYKTHCRPCDTRLCRERREAKRATSLGKTAPTVGLS